MPNMDTAFERIVLPVLSGGMMIVEEYGRQALAQFMEEISMVQSGIPYEKLGIAERRHAQLPRAYQVLAAKPSQVLFDTQRLTDASLPDNTVAVLTLSGVMRMDGGPSTPGILAMEQDFRDAYNNPKIKAIVLDINSGGGMVSAGWTLANVVSEKNKPVVAYSRYAGSAAYLAAAGADEIIAAPGSQTGGIGAFIPINLAEIQALKDSVKFIYAAQSTGKNLAERAILNDNNYGPMQAEADQTAAAFIAYVQKMRPVKGSELIIAETFSGPMFDPATAKRRGLTDMTGTFTQALNRAALLGSRQN